MPDKKLKEAKPPKNANGVQPEEDKKPLVDERGVALSPFPDYPGQITFPIPFTGQHYRTLTKFLVKDDSENGDWSGDFFNLLPYWRVVNALATVEVEGVAPGAEFDDVPASVLRWARDAAIEYTDRFLTYGR